MEMRCDVPVRNKEENKEEEGLNTGEGKNSEGLERIVGECCGNMGIGVATVEVKLWGRNLGNMEIID